MPTLVFPEVSSEKEKAFLGDYYEPLFVLRSDEKHYYFGVNEETNNAGMVTTRSRTTANRLWELKGELRNFEDSILEMSRDDARRKAHKLGLEYVFVYAEKGVSFVVEEEILV